MSKSPFEVIFLSFDSLLCGPLKLLFGEELPYFGSISLFSKVWGKLYLAYLGIALGFVGSSLELTLTIGFVGFFETVNLSESTPLR